MQLPSEIEFQILDHESEKETVVDHTCQSQLINLSRISRKRNTGLKNLYLIDDQDWEKIDECEISNFSFGNFFWAFLIINQVRNLNPTPTPRSTMPTPDPTPTQDHFLRCNHCPRPSVNDECEMMSFVACGYLYNVWAIFIVFIFYFIYLFIFLSTMVKWGYMEICFKKFMK